MHVLSSRRAPMRHSQRAQRVANNGADRDEKGGDAAMVTVERLHDELEAITRRVATCEGVLAIQDLKARYADLVDRRFCRGQVISAGSLEEVARQIAELFTVDGVWDGGPALGRVAGRGAIAERLRTPTLDFSRHIFVNPRIRVDGDTATGRWDLLSPCRAAGMSYWMSGYEDDEYRNVDGVWLHQSMKLTTVVMAPVAEGWTEIYA